MFGLFKKKATIDPDDGFDWSAWVNSDICNDCLSIPREYRFLSSRMFKGKVCHHCGSRNINHLGVVKVFFMFSAGSYFPGTYSIKKYIIHGETGKVRDTN